MFSGLFPPGVPGGAPPTLKTGNGERRSWVQIPPHPFFGMARFERRNRIQGVWSELRWRSALPVRLPSGCHRREPPDRDFHCRQGRRPSHFHLRQEVEHRRRSRAEGGASHRRSVGAAHQHHAASHCRSADVSGRVLHQCGQVRLNAHNVTGHQPNVLDLASSRLAEAHQDQGPLIASLLLAAHDYRVDDLVRDSLGPGHGLKNPEVPPLWKHELAGFAHLATDNDKSPWRGSSLRESSRFIVGVSAGQLDGVPCCGVCVTDPLDRGWLEITRKVFRGEERLPGSAARGQRQHPAGESDDQDHRRCVPSGHGMLRL